MRPASKARSSKNRATVQSVERTFDILETLAEQGELGLLDLSERVRLHPSTVHRLLTTLLQNGYVRQNERTGRYSLGTRLLQLGRVIHHHSTLRAEARPFLERLTQASGETTNLSILDHDAAVYIDQVESPHLVRMFAQIGQRVPWHSTGCGKVLLAYLEPAKLNRILRKKSLPAYTRNTITRPSELERALAEIRRCGYAVDDEETEEGVRCVAGPVRDHTGKVIAALSLSGPITRLTKEKIPHLGKLVAEACAELSAILGYQAT